MKPHRATLRSVLPLAVALASFGSWGTARAGMVTYVVTADTSSLSGLSGYLDFQFNPNGAAPVAPNTTSATITAFTTDGVLGAPLPPIGDASGGPLPLPVTIVNDDPGLTNDYTQGITFGTTLTFDVTLSGTDVGAASAGDLFAFSLQDVNFVGSSTGPGGSIVTIAVNADGSTTGTAYDPINPGGPTATVTPLGAVPEPSSVVGTLTALGAALGYRGFRRLRAA